MLIIIGIVIVVFLYYIYKSLDEQKKLLSKLGDRMNSGGEKGPGKLKLDKGEIKDIVFYDSKILADEDKELGKEIEKRKQRARELRIPEIFINFEEPFTFYPTWLLFDDLRNKAPSIVTNAEELENKLDNFSSFKKIKITLNSKDYILSFAWKDYLTYNEKDCWKYGRLEIILNGKRVLELIGELDYPNFKKDVINIVSFIEGDWINDFLKISQEYKLYEQKAKVEGKRNWEKTEKEAKDKRLEELKKGFGIKR